MHSCQKGAGAVSAVCLASAQSSHMFSDMWEFELAQGGLHSSMQLISLSLHTNPAILSMQMKGAKRRGLSWVCSVSASLLLHFKWINDKSPPIFLFSWWLSSLILPCHSLSCFSSISTSRPTSHSRFTASFLLLSGVLPTIFRHRLNHSRLLILPVASLAAYLHWQSFSVCGAFSSQSFST